MVPGRDVTVGLGWGGRRGVFRVNVHLTSLAMLAWVDPAQDDPNRLACMSLGWEDGREAHRRRMCRVRLPRQIEMSSDDSLADVWQSNSDRGEVRRDNDESS